MKLKWRNYGLYVALGSLLGLFVNDMGLLAPEQYQDYVDGVLAILVAAGVISNPSKGHGFKDKEGE